MLYIKRLDVTKKKQLDNDEYILNQT